MFAALAAVRVIVLSRFAGEGVLLILSAEEFEPSVRRDEQSDGCREIASKGGYPTGSRFFDLLPISAKCKASDKARAPPARGAH